MSGLDTAANRPLTTQRSSLWTALDRIATPMTGAKGHLLFKQGESARGVFLLRKGKIRLYMHSPRKKELSCRIVGPGSILGFPATFSNSAYSLSAENLAQCEIGFVEASDLIELMSQDAELCFYALQSMSHEVRKLRKTQASLLCSAHEANAENRLPAASLPKR